MNISFSTHLGKYVGAQLLDYLVTEFSFVKTCQTVFQTGCMYHFAFSPAVSESSYCSKSSLTFDAVSVLVSWVLAILIDVWWYLIYANFNLHFPGDIGCGTYFNIIICMSSLVRCLLISFAYF